MIDDDDCSVLASNKMVIAGIQQQRRLANKIVLCVYGVVTDGLTYEFLRLEPNLRLQVPNLRLHVSRPYQASFASERREV